MRVALFVACFNDLAFPATGRATVEVLERLGHEVVFPTAQTCCGQMHLNTGYRREALALARHFARVFSPFEAVVTPSASCAGTVAHSYADLAGDAGDSELSGELAALAGRVFELSQFLVDVLGVSDVGAEFPHQVAYHPTCHSLRGLQVYRQPLELLRHVRGLHLVDLPGEEQCCGFGGTFSVKNHAVSLAMMADKLAAVRLSGAEVVCAVDNSCLAQIGGGARRLSTGARVMHLAEVLASTAEAPERAVRAARVAGRYPGRQGHPRP